MVDAHDHRAARLTVGTGVVFNQVELPQRMAPGQRLHGQIADALLQGLLLLALGAARQFFDHHVACDVEFRVLDPGGAGGVLDHALTEAVVFKQPLLDALAQRGVRDAGLQHPDADDHHQIAGAVHAQPGGIDAAHALARQAQRACDDLANVFLHRAGGAAGALADLTDDVLRLIRRDDAGDHEGSCCC